MDELSTGEAANDFEWVVAERLREEGYDCIPQVGVDNFRIDIDVRHSHCGDAFLAGIECDGAPFHSGFTVRDRDRIRQQVLEGLNWKIWRIWSVDWFQDPEREMQKLLAWLAALRENARIQEFGDEYAVQKVSDSRVNSIAELAAELEQDTETKDPTSMERECRALKPVDGIDWYEFSRNQVYTVWEGPVRKGVIRVLSRATQAPRLYGDRVAVQKTEYEAIIDASREKQYLTTCTSQSASLAMLIHRLILEKYKENQIATLAFIYISSISLVFIVFRQDLI